MAPMTSQSLSQGEQFANMHVGQHGGGNIDAGSYPTVLSGQPLLSGNMAASARIAPLDAAIDAVKGLKDQTGGGRRRKGRKASKKARKGSKKSRKGSRKSRKTRRMRGGAFGDNAQSVNASGMLLDGGQMAKALSGMNAEWKLAESPSSFAPGVATKYPCN